MGVSYKLTPAIKRYILKQKKDNPRISCRSLAAKIKKRFAADVSKSAVNLLLKKKGFREKRGRKPKIKPSVIKELGRLFLVAAEQELGIYDEALNLLKERFPKIDFEFLPLLWEKVLYSENLDYSQEVIFSLVGKKLNKEKMERWFQELLSQKGLAWEAAARLQPCFRNCLYLKIGVFGRHSLYIDSQFRSLWPEPPRIPLFFSAGLNRTKRNIRMLLERNSPIILLTAAGATSNFEEITRLILASQEQQDMRLTTVGLYAREREIIEEFHLVGMKKRGVIFGIFPQHQLERKEQIQLHKKFKAHFLSPLKVRVYISEGYIKVSESLTLRAIYLKQSLHQKGYSVTIATNLAPSQMSAWQIAKIYLSHWPSPENAYQDYLEKTVRSTYQTIELKYNDIKGYKDYLSKLNLEEIAQIILKNLHLYCLEHFFPHPHKEMDMLDAKKRFYSISGSLYKKKGCLIAELRPKQDKEALFFACQRVNEGGFVSPQGKRIWFEVT